MTGLSFINEMVYTLFNIPYYEAFIYKNKTQIGRILQPESFSSIAIVDIPRKKAWMIDNTRCFFSGNKIIVHLDVDSAIPLKEQESVNVIEVNEFVSKEIKTKKVSFTVTPEQKRKSFGKEITRENFPPEFLFELLNAHFVIKSIAVAKSKWEALAVVFIVIVIGICFIAWQITSKVQLGG